MKVYNVTDRPSGVSVRVTTLPQSHDLESILPYAPGDRVMFSLEPESCGREMLAFALLWSASQSFLTAFLWYQEFARLFLGRPRGKRWRTTDEEITSWVVQECANSLNVMNGEGASQLPWRSR